MSFASLSPVAASRRRGVAKGVPNSLVFSLFGVVARRAQLGDARVEVA
jgi:hypothetical protein